MKAAKVNPNWLKKRESEIANNLPIDVTTSFNSAIQALIIRLTLANKSFKLYNLGAGVKRVTTDTDKCPCCKRPF